MIPNLQEKLRVVIAIVVEARCPSHGLAKGANKNYLQNSQQNNRQIISQLLPLRQQFNSSLFTTRAADSNLLAQIDEPERRACSPLARHFSPVIQTEFFIFPTRQAAPQIAGIEAQRRADVFEGK